jgi:serine/threonine-protein kinase
MGVVWRARRADGLVKRPVALKLLHAGFYSSELLARFARERDILAALTHPNIARLYDAGFTATGQPFLALEFVEGLALTEYCDRKRLDVRERLRLMLQVLTAVQYAHSHLVVHRDLKPSNILVTTDGQVQLLDFGIAKLIVDGSAPETHLTLLGGRALTPDYASPEQIAGESLSTSSDVYSLGVVLYELTTGVRPYRLKRDTRGALEEAVLTVEPQRPSQAAIDSSIAECRSMTVRKMRAALSGALDTVILKALKKRPSERYATADAFRQDIERYLSGHSVQAKSDTLWYRSKTFLARNRLMVGAAATVVAALVAGLGIALWQAGVARQQARIAQDQARTAEAVQGFMEDLFQANTSDQTNPELARRTTARELLDRGSDKIKTTLTDAPAAKLRVLKTLSHMYRDLDLANKAADLARERVALARSQYGAADVRLAQPLVDLGDVANSADLADEAGEALADAQRILDHAKDRASPTRAKLDAQLAYHYFGTGDTSRAVSLAEQAVQLLRPRGASYDLAFALWTKAIASVDADDPKTAKAALREALSLVTATNGQINSLLPDLYSLLGFAEKQLAEFADAESNMRRGVAMSQSISGAETPSTLERIRELGDFLVSTSRTDGGIAVLTSAREVALKIAARGEPSATPAFLLISEARALIGYGRFEQGLAELRTAKQIRDKLDPVPWVAARLQERTAAGLVEIGQYSEAKRLLAEAAAAESSLGWEGTLNYNDNISLRSHLLLAEGRSDEAAKTFAAFRTVDGASRLLVLPHFEQMVTRAEILLAQGEVDKAVEQAAKVRVGELTNENRTYLKTYESRALLVEGRARLLIGQASQALSLLEQAVTLDRQLYDVKQSPVLADAEIALANCYLTLRQPDQARSLLVSAEAIHATHRELGLQYKRPLRELRAHLTLVVGQL